MHPLELLVRSDANLVVRLMISEKAIKALCMPSGVSYILQLQCNPAGNGSLKQKKDDCHRI